MMKSLGRMGLSALIAAIGIGCSEPEERTHDHRKIAFASNWDVNRVGLEIYVMHADGCERTNLTIFPELLAKYAPSRRSCAARR